MTETGPRRQQAEERREQILDAAIRIFCEKGFAGTTIRDIAREVGVTEGLLYHYFESKEALENACWKERTWRAELERILNAAEGKPVEAVLREIVTDFLGTLRRHAPLVRMNAAESLRNPELKAEHLAKIEDNHLRLVGFLRERQANGELRQDADVSTGAGLLMGCSYSCFLLWGGLDDQAWDNKVRDLANSGVDVVMRGISPGLVDVE